MAAASPIDIATPRFGSRSPPDNNQTSNLTSQLQAERQQRSASGNMQQERRGSEFRPGSLMPESYSNGYGSSFRSRPISMKERDRRESNNLAGSLLNGMSWGGLSVGSFIRDDILMTGTSPYNFQSPSFHSSSYLPKMEANFMKDYICCGITLDSLHELLQHYEEAHAQVPTQTMGRTPKDQQLYANGRSNAANTAAMVQQQAQQQEQNDQFGSRRTPMQSFNNQSSALSQGFGVDPLSSSHNMDELDDMEMDDAAPAPAVQQPQQNQFQPQPQFGRQQARAPQLNMGMANAFQGQQGFSTPTTPQASQNFGLQNNPTVSSVNTPTFGQSSQNMKTPDSSNPHTPDLELDYNNLYSTGLNFNQQTDNSNYNSMGNNDMTIDQPAKALLSKGMGGLKGFPNGQFAQNSELAKRLREQQMIQGITPNGFGFGEEVKPFKCPVIGCEKAYKNQNGLKYHKQHGHQNQQLKENPDGTFSIVDPATSIPYPGTVGMEKEKPYRCEVCGKRYKNLNGLKYHRQHSPPCNPDLKLNPSNVPGAPNTLQGMNVNVAGAGLMGMGDGLGF